MDQPSLRQTLERMIAGEIPAPPIAGLLGFSLRAIGDGTSEFAIQAGPHLANPMGTLHGGVLCDIGDAAMGTAVASTLTEPGVSYTTIELKINFFKPVWTGLLVARARVVRSSRSLAYAECDVTDEKGSLVARLGSTCMILRGEAAKGR